MWRRRRRMSCRGLPRGSMGRRWRTPSQGLLEKVVQRAAEVPVLELLLELVLELDLEQLSRMPRQTLMTAH